MLALKCCIPPSLGDRFDEANPNNGAVAWLDLEDMDGHDVTNVGWYFVFMNRFGDDCALPVVFCPWCGLRLPEKNDA
jgi:hypothetical protein